MQTWADGYITEIPYTRDFYTDLSPATLRLTCVLAGITPPRVKPDFDYCELGCGQGLTLALLAAAFPQGRFYGVDFNPTHIGLARKFTEAAEISNVTFLDASFEEVMDRDDLPQFDYIALHGIYSWVSRTQRRYISTFLNRRLKPGGLVYNSYNAQPGRMNLEPIRRIFKELLPPSQKPHQQVQNGFELLETLMKHPLGVFKKLGGLSTTIQKLKQHHHQYIAHEFLNEHWTSFYCTDMFREMADAKLSYVGSTIPGLNFATLSVPPFFLKQYKSMDTLEQRQLFRDLLLNTAFRKDVYVRGPMPIVPAEQQSIHQTIYLGRAPFHEAFQPKYRCGASDVDISDDKVPPIIYEKLSQAIMPLSELMNGFDGISPRKVMEGLRHLLAGNQITVYAANKSQLQGMCQVNRISLAEAVRDWRGAWLCSEMLGNAVFLPFIQALLLNTYLDSENPETIPETTADLLTAKGAGITVKNREIKERPDMVRHLRDMYANLSGTISELERLGVLAFPK